jgi:uncharacterized MAPEG superfamily protein
MHTALLCVLVAGLLPYLYTSISKIAGPRYDNRDVRGWQGRLAGLPYRANAAHLNSFESFPLFAASVLAALATGADAGRVNILAIGYVVLRLVYGAVYLMNLAVLRSLVWFASMACTIAIFVAALRAMP